MGVRELRAVAGIFHGNEEEAKIVHGLVSRFLLYRSRPRYGGWKLLPPPEPKPSPSASSKAQIPRSDPQRPRRHLAS